MCTWKIGVIQQLTLVSVTNSPEGLPLPITKPTQICGEIANDSFDTAQICGETANDSFETIICHRVVNVYMESCCTPTANTCIRDQLSGRAALTNHLTNTVGR